jgi:hypothetical protein
MSSKIDESNVNHPSHYNIEGELETIRKMEQYMSVGELIAWCKGCIFAYIDRAKYKNGLEDLHKAMWHVNYVLQWDNFNKSSDYEISYKSPTCFVLKYQVFERLKLNEYLSVKIILQFMIDNYNSL